MLRFAADENFNGDIVRGLLRRNPKFDIVRGASQVRDRSKSLVRKYLER